MYELGISYYEKDVERTTAASNMVRKRGENGDERGMRGMRGYVPCDT